LATALVLLILELCSTLNYIRPTSYYNIIINGKSMLAEAVLSNWQVKLKSYNYTPALLVTLPPVSIYN